jgi:hypothetical protein
MMLISRAREAAYAEPTSEAVAMEKWRRLIFMGCLVTGETLLSG